MVERPKVGEDVIDVMKGQGGLATETDFLRHLDSASFEYEKLKKAENKYLDDKMWTEAALRGETSVLADLLTQREKLDKQRLESEERISQESEQMQKILRNMGGDEKTQQQAKDDYDAINKWKEYSAANDYDGYILALSLPTLDNTKKVKRTDEATGYEFGDYTDREWARLILESTFARYEAYQIEANKATQNFFEKMNAYLNSGVKRFLAGISNFCQGIYDIGEGLLNIFVNWSGDEDIGQRFLYAFSNNDEYTQPFAELSRQLTESAFQFERDYTAMYDAVKAYYSEDGDGYTTWGRWYTSAFESLGYMVPSMLIGNYAASFGLSPMATAIAGTGSFYAGVFAGNISETVSAAQLQGISYKDLDAGEVVSNAMTKAAYQWAVEYALGKLIGWSGLDKAMRGGKVAEKTVQVGTSKAKAALITGGRLVKGMAKEGLEEVLQDMSDGLIDYFYAQQNTNLKQVYEESVEQKWNLQNLVDSFVVAAFTELGTGIVKSAKYILPKNRAIGATVDGKTYTLGFFQTLNFNEAMQTLNGYNETLNNDKASVADKADAAFKMSVAIDSMGSVFANIGQDRAIAANNILVGYLNDKAKKEEINKLSNPLYARSLYDSFVRNYSNIYTKYHIEKLQSKIEKAIKKKADKLKESGASQIDNVITAEIDPEDTNINLPNDSVKKFVSQLKELGAEAIIGTDGSLITKSGDIVIVPNELLVRGDLATIVKGIAYEQVQEAVKVQLTESQRKLITDLYTQATGLDAEVDEAITALLFDKHFYTKALLLSGERRYKSESINLLATIDKIAKTTAAKELQNGNLTNRAYQVLMNKVYETMRAGLINYATNYVNLDLDSISADILTKDMKDIIKNHRNTIFTTAINDGIKRTKKSETIQDAEITRYDYYLNKFADRIDGNTLNALKEKIRSKNYKDQLDAYAFLQCIAKASSDYDYTNTKLVYLVSPEEGRSLLEQNYISNLERYFGNTIKSFADGSYNVNKLTDAAKQLIQGRGYNLTDDYSRLSCLTNALFEMSGKTLTLDQNYNICRVLNKNEFLDKRFLGKNGNKILIEELKEGKIKTIKDIVNSKVKLPNYMKDITIQLTTADVKGAYKDGDTFIQVGYSATTNTLMHELTHLTQYIIAQNTPKGETYVGGGSSLIFKSLPYDIAQDLNQYVKENFPLTYDFIANLNNKYTYADIVYNLLEGELQANTILNTFIPNMGFKYKIVDGERYLVSPDGKKTWSLASVKVSGKYTIPGIIREAKTKTTETKQSDFNAIYKYGKKDAELSKTLPVNDAGKKVINKYNVDPNKAFNYTLDLAGIERTNDYSQMLKDVYAANVNTLELAEADRKLYQAGIMYIRNMAKYNKVLDTWMKSVESKMKETAETPKKPAGPIEINAKPNKSTILEAMESHDEPYDKARTKYIESKPEIREQIKNAYFTDKNGYQPMIYRSAWSRKMFDIKIDKNLDTRHWKGIYYSTNPYVSVDLAHSFMPSDKEYRSTDLDKQLKGVLTNLKESELIFVDLNGQHWDEIEYNGPEVSAEVIGFSEDRIKDAKLRKEFAADLKKPGFITNGESITTDQLANILTYYYRDDFLSGAKKAIVFFNVYEVPSEDHPDTDILIFDKNSIIPITKEDYGDFIAKTEPGMDEGSAYKPLQSRIISKSNQAAISKLKLGEMAYNQAGNIFKKISNIEIDFKNLPDIERELISPNKEHKYYLYKKDIPAKYNDRLFLSVLNQMSENKEEAHMLKEGSERVYVNLDLLNEDMNKGRIGQKSFYYDKTTGRTYSILSEAQLARLTSYIEGVRNTEFVHTPEGYTFDKDEGQWYKNGKPVEGPIVDGKLVKSVYELRDRLDEANISYEEDLRRSKRYVSNKIAEESNLKYWIKKGVPIQIDPNIRKFVISTTKEFNQLPKILQNKIQKGTLTKFDIIDYVATAANIDDFTLKHIARDIFGNEALAKITFKDLRKLQENIEYLSVLPYTIDSKLINKEMTPTQLLELREEVFEKAKTDKALAKKLAKAIDIANKVYLNEDQKRRGQPEVVEVDDKQLNSVFFRNYKGTPGSLRHINNIAKYVAARQEYNPSAASGAGSIDAEVNTGDYGEAPTSVKDKGKVWNYIDRKRLAETIYEYDDVSKTLDIISREDKLKTVQDYITDVITTKLKSLPADIQRAQAKAAINRLNSEIEKLNNLSDEQLNKRYLTVMEKESSAKKEIEQIIAPTRESIKGEPKTTKNRKDQVRNLLNQLTEKIADKVTRYNALTNKSLIEKLTNKNIQEFLDSETYYRNPEMYKDMTDDQLDTLIKDLKTVNQYMKQAIGKQEVRKYGKEIITKKLEKESKRIKREVRKEYEAEKKTLREKIQIDYKYKTQIKEQTFEFVTPERANKTVEKILSTEFNKTRMSTVQGLTNNVEQDVLNGKKFFEQNVDAIMSSDLHDIESASRWFIQAKMNNITSEEFRKYSAMKLYFLTYVLGETKQGGLYADMNANLKQQIENAIKSEVSNAGTTLAAWNNVRDLINPLEAMKNADMELDGVKIPVAEKTEFFEAIQSNDINKIVEAQQKIINYAANKKTAKKSILRKITTIRSMSMLSGPLTWLRNKVSNMALKRLNKLASKLGNAMFKNAKTQASQIKMTKNVTPEIQNFITKNFIDNKFFDKFVSNLSKYNPSEISEKFRDAGGKPTREAIMAQLVIKSMYNEYYNKNIFKSKFMNSIYDKLMKVMSDDSYVREAAVRYFGKILAEKGYDFQKITEINDNIMNDFATSIGLALSDYMHSDNFFYSIEKAISEKSELGWFAYKLLLPYAGASWNWFKAMINMSPIGLAKSIWKITHLEKEINKAEAAWASGKTSVNPELTEYIVRRDLGQGVMGTIAWALGMLLAGLGFIKLDDDDYGTPKIKIGNITVDVSSIFGTSSLLSGAALVNGMQAKGLNWEGFLQGLNNMADFTLSSFPLMDIIEMDMYSDGGFSMGMEQLEDIALSYIPNIISWIAGATYKGNVNKNTFWKRAIAKIPFMANFLPKKVDVYSGEEGTWWDAANRVIPYFSYTPRTTAETKSKQLGLNKTELRGQYTINGEEFNISDKDRNTINKAYGQWNAEDLEKFYNNRMTVKVKDTKTNTYKSLSYNQMNDYQRKYAVQTIMSNNAELAKIKAWTMSGNKYYASATMYTKLTKRGVRSNVYKGNKGFVKK